MSIEISQDGIPCPLDKIACHTQSDPYPGGLTFRLRITMPEMTALRKYMRGLYDIGPIPYRWSGDEWQGERSVFDYIDLRPEKRYPADYILNKIIEAVFETDYCEFTIVGSPVVTQEAFAMGRLPEGDAL